MKLTRQKPEYHIVEDIIRMLRYKGWFVKKTHGNAFSYGWPDLFACHSLYGQRWIEVKHTIHFTDAQIIDFPKFCANGSGVWVLIEATENEYQKLFKKPNWSEYLI